MRRLILAACLTLLLAAVVATISVTLRRPDRSSAAAPAAARAPAPAPAPPPSAALSRDLKAEAAELAERGRAYQRLAEYDEALALLEESLRLNPHQPRVHFDIVNILRRLPVTGPNDRNIR